MKNITEMIGYVVGGGLKENLRVRLTIPSEQVQEGAFVVIESGSWQFYGLVTDLQLGSTDPRFADEAESRLPLEMARLPWSNAFTTTNVTGQRWARAVSSAEYARR
jgi:hypothetical protein